jgi:hypothetical protein
MRLEDKLASLKRKRLRQKRAKFVKKYELN